MFLVCSMCVLFAGDLFLGGKSLLLLFHRGKEKHYSLGPLHCLCCQSFLGLSISGRIPGKAFLLPHCSFLSSSGLPREFCVLEWRAACGKDSLSTNASPEHLHPPAMGVQELFSPISSASDLALLYDCLRTLQGVQ